MGLFGYALPEEYGGLGRHDEPRTCSWRSSSATPRRPSARCSAPTTASPGRSSPDSATRSRSSTYLPRWPTGRLIGSFALTEAEAGSDPGRPAHHRPPRRRRSGSSTAASGTSPTPRSPTSSWSSPAPTPPRRAAVASPASSSRPRRPGVSVGPKDKKMGQAGAWTAEVFFDDVRVPADRADRRGGPRLRQGADRALPRPAAHRRALRRHGPAGARRVGRPTPRAPSRAAPRSAGSSWCRRCSPTCTPSCWPPAAWCGTSPRATTAARTRRSARRRRSCSAPRWSAGPSTARCRCTAAWATCGRRRSSASTATPGCSASTRAPARCSG